MLTGIEVLEVADENASFSTRLLALLGARVIKIEPPGGGPERGMAPFMQNVPGPQESLSFCYNNTNKLGITLNLSKPQGRKLFQRLIERADVLVETFSPDEIKNLDLGYPALSAINRRLIQASVTGFGRVGPRSNYRSCDLVAAAYGGSMSVTGAPTLPPLKPGGEQSRFAGSLFAVLGILLALRQRKKNGRGTYLDLSLQEAMTATLEHVMVRYFGDHITPKRQGNRHWNEAFCILPCQDGFIQLTLFQQWETLIGLIAGDGMACDLTEDRWKDEQYRRSNAEHIIEVMTAWTKSRDVQELFQLGQLLGFPWAPVRSLSAVLEDPQLRHRNFFRPHRREEGGDTFRDAGLPFRFGDIPHLDLKGPPVAGEDNTRIYRDEVGLSKDEMERLATEGII